MKSTLFVLLVMTFTLIYGSLQAEDVSSSVDKMNQMPMSFSKNIGQWDERVLFRANAGGATMWFTKEGVTYQFTRRVGSGTRHVPAALGESGSSRANAVRPYGSDERDSVDQLVISAKFIGANPNPEIIAEGQMKYKCNYFLGNDPSKWHTEVPNYEAITLKDIYPGIDLKYSVYGIDHAAYEFIAAPGAEIAQIKVAYEGAESTSFDGEGKLILKTKWGDMVADMKSPTDGVLSGKTNCALWTPSSELARGEASQALAGNSGTLTLEYSTYLGGGSEERANDITVDSGGSVYVTGFANSSNFPTLNPYQTYQGGFDVFVTKLSSSGNSLIYGTYLGGGEHDYGCGIAVDSGGNAYVTGYTSSPNFPTLNPYQTYQGGWDAFVAKLSSTGDSLIYSTYLGGENGDYGYDIAVDDSGNAYVTGFAASSFPTLNPYQTYQGNFDAFVTKLSGSGNSLIYSTCLGGGNYDVGSSVVVDDSGNAYVAGYTFSSNFPTQNPYQTFQGAIDAFVAKLSSTGNSLIYGTYLGGGGEDYGYGIAVDSGGYAYVTGQTISSDFPTLNPLQADQGVADAFVTKLSYYGDSLIYSTYLGGGSEDRGYGIAINGSNAYVTGWTSSSDFPTASPYQTDQGGDDAFVAKLSSAGDSLIYSTYLGGGGNDYGERIAVDSSGNAYMTGRTYSSNFPILNPYQTYQGDCDAFVTKLSWTSDYLCGDADREGTINIADAVYLIAYIFSGGPAPAPMAAGDADCSSDINIADAVYLINYIFKGGPAPCAGC